MIYILVSLNNKMIGVFKSLQRIQNHLFERGMVVTFRRKTNQTASIVDQATGTCVGYVRREKLQ